MISNVDILLKEYIDRSINNGNLNQAYIFEGAEGTGRSDLATYVAEVLLCKGDATEKKPCGACHACRLLESGNHPDCIIVTHESAKTISVEEIRNQVVEDIDIRPYYGGRKIYIIPDAELLKKEGQNALLKTIEEPPEYVLIILIVKSRELLLQTIRSRCVTMSFRAEPEFHTDDEAVAEQFIRLENIFYGKGSADVASLMSFAKELSSDYSDYLPEIFTCIERLCRDSLFVKSGILTEKPGAGYIDKTSAMSYEGLERVLNAVKQARHDIQSNVNAEAVMDSLLLTVKQAVSGSVS